MNHVLERERCLINMNLCASVHRSAANVLTKSCSGENFVMLSETVHQ